MKYLIILLVPVVLGCFTSKNIKDSSDIASKYASGEAIIIQQKDVAEALDFVNFGEQILVSPSEKRNHTNAHIYIENSMILEVVDAYDRNENSEVKCRFDGPVSFINCTFKKDVDFASAIFNDDVKFINCFFQGEVNFQNARFMKEVVFYKSNFDREAAFQNAKFFGKTIFNELTAEDNFMISGATFNEKTTFNVCHFKKYIDFSNTTFKDDFTMNYLTAPDRMTIENLMAYRSLTMTGSKIENLVDKNVKINNFE